MLFKGQLYFLYCLFQKDPKAADLLEKKLPRRARSRRSKKRETRGGLGGEGTWVSQPHRVVVKRTGKRKGKAGNETGMSAGEVRWGRVRWEKACRMGLARGNY